MSDWTEKDDMPDDNTAFNMPLKHDIDSAVTRTTWAIENDTEPLHADLLVIAKAYLVLRRSHAEAVEAAVRELTDKWRKQSLNSYFDGDIARRDCALDLEAAFRKHLGPAAGVIYPGLELDKVQKSLDNIEKGRVRSLDEIVDELGG